MTMHDDALLRIRGVHKTFTLHAVDGRTVRGLCGVDLDVPTGRHLSLVGTSGAGKSTLLKSIHRTYRIDAGTIEFVTSAGATVDLADLADSDVAEVRSADIGYVSQFLRAEPRRGVHDVVTRAARRRGLAPDESADRAADILRRLHIDERLWGTFPSLLSGGEKQRVNLAAGLIVPPRLLLLDEPVSALDPANRRAVIDFIGDLATSDTTVLSVFHDLDAIRTLADRVALMRDGVVELVGEPADVLTHLDRAPELV